MKKYYINYRGEFSIIVNANTEEEAIKNAIFSDRWGMISEPHSEFLEVLEEEKTS